MKEEEKDEMEIIRDRRIDTNQDQLKMTRDADYDQNIAAWSGNIEKKAAQSHIQ